MSDSDDEQWVQRALADARADSPAPPDVVARLDARLAALHTERGSAPRRRRVGPLVLAAAAVAAVVAVGLPVARHLGDTTVSSDSASAGGEAAASSEAAPSDAAPSSSAAQGQARLGLTGQGPQLRTTGFGAGVAASLPQLLQAASAYELGGAEIASTCGATPAAGTRGALAVVDGRPALVEISAPSDGHRAVRALSCADASVLATASVPVS